MNMILAVKHTEQHSHSFAVTSCQQGHTIPTWPNPCTEHTAGEKKQPKTVLLAEFNNRNKGMTTLLGRSRENNKDNYIYKFKK